MASIEDRILTNILRGQDLTEALRAGLTEDHFKDPEAKRIYRFTMRHWFHPSTSKTLPTISAIKRRWPGFHLTAVDTEMDGALRAMISDLKIVSFESDTRALANYFQELVDVDPEEAVKEMQSGLSKLRVLLEGKGEQLTVGDIASRAKEHYLAAKEGVIYGLPWPWEPLTRDTMGKRKGKFILFYGRMKSMKTWIMLHCAEYDYSVNNARVLIWARENSEIVERLAALLCKVDYQLFKRGELPPRIEKRMLDTLDALEKQGSLRKVGKDGEFENGEILLLVGRNAPRFLEGLSAEVEAFSPDVVYLDSYYKMRSANSDRIVKRWERVTALAEDVQEAAEMWQVPVIAVAQANRAGEKMYGENMTDLGDADNQGREVDLAIRVIKKRGKELHEEGYEVRKTLPKKKGPPSLRPSQNGSVPDKASGEPVVRYGAEVALAFPGNRDGVLDGILIRAIPGYNFDLISSRVSTEDIKKWAGAEDNESKGKKKKGDDEMRPYTPDSVSTGWRPR